MPLSWWSRVRRPGMLVAMLLCGACIEAPDRHMEAMFSLHSAEFEALYHLVQEDRNSIGFMDQQSVRLIGRVGVVTLDDSAETLALLAGRGVEKGRLKVYRDLMRRLELGGGWVQESGGVVHFRTAHNWDGGTTKGYAYLSSPPDRITATLDRIVVNRGETIYKRLRNCWYLYLAR